MATASAPWVRRAVAWGLTLPLLAPLLLLATSWSTAEPGTWAHLRQYVLPEVARNTLALAALLALLTGVLGIALAWLSARCEYPGRRWLDWALVLPLAMPGYVAAFAYVGLLDYAGPIQSAWRAWSGSRAALPDLHSVPGAALVLALVLYPYVYLLARAAFLRQGGAAFDAARALGYGPLTAFLRVALPLARPAWFTGLTLALLEALADFGTVSVLGIDTFTTAIYKTWFGLYSLPAAAQLASVLLLLVALALALEVLLCGRRVVYERSLKPMPRLQLRGIVACAASTFACLVFALGFLLPVLRLLQWAWQTEVPLSPLLAVSENTLALGAGVALTVVALGALLALLERQARGDPGVRLPVFFANLGYAVPGTVLAVAVMLLLLGLERGIAKHAHVSLAFSASVAAVLFALTLRFLRVGYGPLAAGLRGLRPELVDSARLLGAGPLRRFGRIVLPLLRPSVLTALLLVAVETMKEMPATLMLRPFGWDTLAVKIYGYTSEGLWHEAAWPALVLVAIGLLPVRWLVRMQE